MISLVNLFIIYFFFCTFLYTVCGVCRTDIKQYNRMHFQDRDNFRALESLSHNLNTIFSSVNLIIAASLLSKI